MLVAVTAVAKTAVLAAALASSHAYTVVQGDTLSGIAASHGVSLSSVEADNPQFSENFNLIYVGQTVNLSGGGSAVSTESAPVHHYSSPASATFTPTPAPTHSFSSSSGDDSSSLSDVPGVPSGFAACVAERESSDGANQAYNGGVYGIITASGINVNGQSLSAQKAAFSQLYAEDGTQPWAPSDGC